MTDIIDCDGFLDAF